jgi:hypothetical protein
MFDLSENILDVMGKETRKEAEELAAKHPVLADWDYL